jgi:hypothetical protein
MKNHFGPRAFFRPVLKKPPAGAPAVRGEQVAED